LYLRQSFVYLQCDEALEELENVVEFLRNPDKFNAVGATFPKGEHTLYNSLLLYSEERLFS